MTDNNAIGGFSRSSGSKNSAGGSVNRSFYANSPSKSNDHDINELRKMLQDTSGGSNESDYFDNLSDSDTSTSSYDGPNILNYSSPYLETHKQCRECGKESYVKVKEERDELLKRFRRGEASQLTIEERRELERLLDESKCELFHHQKQSRVEIDELKEMVSIADGVVEEKDQVIADLRKELEVLRKKAADEKPVFATVQSSHVSYQAGGGLSLSPADSIPVAEYNNIELKLKQMRRQYDLNLLEAKRETICAAKSVVKIEIRCKAARAVMIMGKIKRRQELELDAESKVKKEGEENARKVDSANRQFTSFDINVHHWYKKLLPVQKEMEAFMTEISAQMKEMNVALNTMKNWVLSRSRRPQMLRSRKRKLTEE